MCKTWDHRKSIWNKKKYEIGKLSIANDTAFNVLRDIKAEMTEITEDIKSHDTTILSNRTNVAPLRQSMTE